MFIVYLTDLEFYAYHGVPVEERAVGHRYRVSLRIEVDGMAVDTDDIDDTVDYAAAAETVLDVSGGAQYRTLERLASDMASELLSRFELATSVWIKLEKRLPPAEVIADTAGVELELRRD